eukprot:XP_014770757.1 PREDICTED: flocculation protein FLO11-like [Octopus bimaculoides]
MATVDCTSLSVDMCFNFHDTLFRVGRPQWTTLFNVGSGKSREEKDNGVDTIRLESSENPGVQPAGHVNFAVYMSCPAYVVVHTYSRLSDVVGYHVNDDGLHALLEVIFFGFEQADSRCIYAWLLAIKGDNEIVPVVESCASDYMTIWMGLIYAYKGLLLVIGCFLAWETRHVSIPALNDSKYIGMSVYNVVIMCTCGAAVSIIIKDKPTSAFIIIGLFIIFCTTITLCLLFVPKIIELKRDPKGDERARMRATFKKPSSKQISIEPPNTELHQKLTLVSDENMRYKQILEQKNKEIQELMEQLGDEASLYETSMKTPVHKMVESLKTTDTSPSKYSRSTITSDGDSTSMISDLSAATSIWQVDSPSGQRIYLRLHSLGDDTSCTESIELVDFSKKPTFNKLTPMREEFVQNEHYDDTYATVFCTKSESTSKHSLKSSTEQAEVPIIQPAEEEHPLVHKYAHITFLDGPVGDDESTDSLAIDQTKEEEERSIISGDMPGLEDSSDEDTLVDYEDCELADNQLSESPSSWHETFSGGGITFSASSNSSETLFHPIPATSNDEIQTNNCIKVEDNDINIIDTEALQIAISPTATTTTSTVNDTNISSSTTSINTATFLLETMSSSSAATSPEEELLTEASATITRHRNSDSSWGCSHSDSSCSSTGNSNEYNKSSDSSTNNNKRTSNINSSSSSSSCSSSRAWRRRSNSNNSNNSSNSRITCRSRARSRSRSIKSLSSCETVSNRAESNQELAENNNNSEPNDNENADTNQNTREQIEACGLLSSNIPAVSESHIWNTLNVEQSISLEQSETYLASTDWPSGSKSEKDMEKESFLQKSDSFEKLNANKVGQKSGTEIESDPEQKEIFVDTIIDQSNTSPKAMNISRPVLTCDIIERV